MKGAEVKAPATTKVSSKRGIANARGTSRLKFSHTHMDTTNGLFIISIDSIIPSGDTAVFLKLGATSLTA